MEFEQLAFFDFFILLILFFDSQGFLHGSDLKYFVNDVIETDVKRVYCTHFLERTDALLHFLVVDEDQLRVFLIFLR